VWGGGVGNGTAEGEVEEGEGVRQGGWGEDEFLDVLVGQRSAGGDPESGEGGEVGDEAEGADAAVVEGEGLQAREVLDALALGVVAGCVELGEGGELAEGLVLDGLAADDMEGPQGREILEEAEGGEVDGDREDDAGEVVHVGEVGEPVVLGSRGVEAQRGQP